MTAVAPFPEPSWYRQESETFVSIVRELNPALALDYTAQSIQVLEQFIAEQFDPPGSQYVGDNLPIGVGCYVGETIIQTLGGHWNAAGKPEINDLGPVAAIFPIRQAVQRFQNGSEESLAQYYEVVARYARQ
jgi:hypothetical protein